MVRGRYGKRWTTAEAQGVLEQWKRSGLPLARFAKQQGYVPERLRWWKLKLERGSATLLRFVPVELPASASAAVSARTTSPIEILVPGGVRLLVPEAVEVGAVARLVAALRAASC